MQECVFCKIIKGQIPAYKIYENDKTLAFLDISPLTRGHTLVIPKKHAKDIFEIAPEDLEEVIKTVKKIAGLLRKTLDCQGINLFQANQPIAGQTVFHLHFHVVPRYQDDKIEAWPKSSYQEKDFEGLARKLRAKDLGGS